VPKKTYPREAFRLIRDDAEDVAARELGRSIQGEARAQQALVTAEQHAAQEAARTAAILGAEREALDEGALTARDLERAMAFRVGADDRQRRLDAAKEQAALAEAHAHERTLADQQKLVLARADNKVMERDKEKWDEAQKRATLAREEEDAEEAWRKKSDKA